MNPLTGLLWTLAAFLSGSLPFSPLLARRLLHTDLRKVGDGNPGSTNVLRAGGLAIGLLAMLLDFFKAAIPVGLAFFFYHPSTGWMVVIALAPLFGHAFSPFLKGRGGKAVAATFGIWAGLTLGEVPLLLAFAVITFALTLNSSAWSVMFGMLAILPHLLINHSANPLLLLVWLGNTTLLAYKHRAELPAGVQLRYTRRNT
jgi:glycerol-3-phosphate acyltransferase PlsY